MTRREFFLSIFTGLVLGGIFSACFIGGVQRGLDYRDAVTGIDSRAVISEVLHE
jgi:hypothetical protein